MSENKKELTTPKKSFMQGVKAEFKKIIWPAKKTIAKQTTAVVVVSVVLCAIIAALDVLIQFGLSFII